jgi:hypothetical protein
LILIKYYLGNKIKENEMGWTCGTRSAYRDLVGTNEGRSPFGRTGCRWENSIQRVLHEIGQKSVDWIDPALEGTSSGLW